MSEHRIRAQVGVEILESAIVAYLSQPFPPNRHINGIADDLDLGWHTVRGLLYQSNRFRNTKLGPGPDMWVVLDEPK